MVMSPGRHVCLLFLVVLLPAGSGAFFGWFTRKSSSVSSAPQKEPAPDPLSLPSAPFEMTTTDEKFLAEAKIMELSPLDSCHYKVVSHLRASCTDMSEEEIAKLGVSLFNCQAEVEGRRTYPCTEHMTLAECTTPMDPDTWNAYHIVSNRARSVCYATRQLHFRRRTELTVNTLVSTAMNQLETMKMLKAGQEELKELTAESVQRVLSSQDHLLEQQEQLQSNQEKMETSISGNLQMLAEEKALIASGHHQVADMIQGISQRMENVSGQLMAQDAELHEGHEAILSDLAEVRARSLDVYSRLESNLAQLQSYQNQSAVYYDVLMEKLQRMNRSLSAALSAMEHMHRSVEHRLSYIQGFILWAGHWTLLRLICCLVKVRNIAPALPAPPESPVTRLHMEKEMGFCSSTPEKVEEDPLFMETLRKLVGDGLGEDSVLGNETLCKDLSVVASVGHLGWKSQQSTPAVKLRRLSVSTSLRGHDSRLTMTAMDRIPQQHSGAAFDAISESRSRSPNSSVCSNLSVSSMSPRHFCHAITRAGQPCRNKASGGQEFCRVHASGQTSYLT
ncbi:protein brambleberry-like isoform 2-T3 [Anomaloglossus baeobatrachus]|uniref:protein brambleberry-like isoform X2 n=1 Tax=Anomaloglossus baeobatrachus TaxID=238106 RepID=UPI003F5078AC